MSDKKAFVFDTNFIIQNKLLEVIDNLQNDFVLYVTQLSIDERIAQQIRKNIEIYDEAEKLQKNNQQFFPIEYKKTKEEMKEYIKTGVQDIYNQTFKNTVIKYSTNSDSFKKVIQRASDKLPPFSNAKDASDKGFKDCILWFSILDYFKNNGQEEVLFITNDNGFLNNSEYLTNEFNSITGKSIEIKTIAFYNELLGKDNEKDEKKKEVKEIPNIDILRDKIIDIVEDIRLVRCINDFGDEYWVNTFSTSKRFDSKYIKCIFDSLPNRINKHYLENSIEATEVLEYDDRITNGNEEIPMRALEELQKLYEEVKTRFPQYLEQLFEAIAKILNINYIEPNEVLEIDNLPF